MHEMSLCKETQEADASAEPICNRDLHVERGGRAGEAGNAKRHPLARKPRKNWKIVPSSRTTGQTREGRMVTTAIVANKCFEEREKRGTITTAKGGEEKGSGNRQKT